MSFLSGEETTSPSSGAGASTPVGCTTVNCPPPATASIEVRVVLYDPLADAGLYTTWGAGVAVPVETAAIGVKCEMSMTKVVGGVNQADSKSVTIPEDGATPEVVLDETDLAPGSTVDIELPELQRCTHTFCRDAKSGPADPAWVSIHTTDGLVVVADATATDQPAHRNSFQCRVDASYTIRIWLKPKTIVLHWSGAGNFNPVANSGAGRGYSFRVSQDNAGAVTWRFGAGRNTDPRYWRHNLHFAGVPAVPGVNDVSLAVDKPIVNSNRQAYPEYGEDDEGKKILLSIRPRGYSRHSKGFHTNSIGVCVCGVSGAINGTVGDPITDAQVATLITNVRALCEAFRLDASDPHQLCTHFEVEWLHKGKGRYFQREPARRSRPALPKRGWARKWDITWLPVERQTAYEAAHGQLLCTRPVPASGPAPNQEFLHHVYADVALAGTFERAPEDGATQVMTDRVSAYLRELISGP